jgi:hypothetical protein
MQLQNGLSDFSPRTPWWGLIRKWLMVVISPYRPERHYTSYRRERYYMRGPGPAWREKHGGPAH